MSKVGGNKVDNVIKTIVGVGGGLASYLFGGWSALIQTLVFFIVLDYLFAVLVAGVHGELSSKKGFKGIAKKVAILVLVAVSHQVDKVIGDGSLIMDAVIFFYIANELISIIETASKTGLPISDALKNVVDTLKGEDK